MLVLTRTVRDGSISILGGLIEIEILEIKGDKVRLGFNAPAEADVHRSEVLARIQEDDPSKAEQIRNRSAKLREFLSGASPTPQPATADVSGRLITRSVRRG